MADTFTNARPFYDVTFPSSGDGFSISKMRNSMMGLGFTDFVPLQPRAHNPADLQILVRGRDASSFYNPVYYGDGNQRIAFSSGDSPAMVAPVTNPRIDIVYLTPSGDIKIVTGTEAVTPTLPTLAPSGDSRTPICAIWLKTTTTKIVNFEDKDSNSGDGYIYQDLRPWLRTSGAGAAKITGSVTPSALGSTGAIGTSTEAARADHTHAGLTATSPAALGTAAVVGTATDAARADHVHAGINTVTVPIAVSGDAQAAIGTNSTLARSDHVHAGVHGVRMVGQPLIQGDIELSGSGGVLSQSGNRISFKGGAVQCVNFKTGATQICTTTIPDDDTPPQNNEGDQVMTLSITPLNAANILKIDVVVIATGNNSRTGVALFQDAIATALTAAISDLSADGTRCISYTYFMLAGTTSSTTFNVRLGAATANAIFNGIGSGRKYGGVLPSSITITEFAV